jgi:polar amino acid transport system substrate-binding protein
MLTIPLTHLVNFVDNRLRYGRSGVGSEDPLAPIASTVGQEMV